LQKEFGYCLGLLKKMGSFQKAVTKCLEILKTIEKKSSEEAVEKALRDQGKAFVGPLITKHLTCLNETMKTNEESTNGEFDADFGKLFKKQATNLEVTIFGET
jgi:hypothetical protein